MARRVDKPTYTRDISGEIAQWDERDIVFARKDLFRYFGEGTPVNRAYYEAHPEHLEYDTKIAKMPAIGASGGIDSPLFEVQFDAIRKIGTDDFVDGTPSPQRTTIDKSRASEKVKAFARLLGADSVGIGPLRQEWVYSHVGRSVGDSEGYTPWGTGIDLHRHTNAIAMGFRMDYDLTRTAPRFPTLLATAKGYATGAWVSVQLAWYIRELGFSARAHHLYNYRVICVPVAVDCGLGELSRAGYLMTKEEGLCLRLAVVTTDMPLLHDQPIDVGIQSFCDKCKVCAEGCPVGAIPTGDKIESNGVKKWKLDEEKCYRYWHLTGTDCALCMISCPWTKPQTWFHKTMAAMASISGPHQTLMVHADKLFYGKSRGGPFPGFIDSQEK